MDALLLFYLYPFKRNQARYLSVNLGEPGFVGTGISDMKLVRVNSISILLCCTVPAYSEIGPKYLSTKIVIQPIVIQLALHNSVRKIIVIASF